MPFGFKFRMRSRSCVRRLERALSCAFRSFRAKEIDDVCDGEDRDEREKEPHDVCKTPVMARLWRCVSQPSQCTS
jgi:hypothetical protein